MRPINLDKNLLKAVDELLSEFSDGLSEYELMTELDRRYGDLYPKPDWQDKLTLFRHHFFLRHTLYVLQQQFSEEKPHSRWTLEITPVTLCKRIANSEKSSESMLTAHDPLADYYLNLSNMTQETEQSVQSMLDDFWTAMARYQVQPEALQILGLNGTESHVEQKRKYRLLAQQHHPDKGGDSETFHAIQQAWEQLKK